MEGGHQSTSGFGFRLDGGYYRPVCGETVVGPPPPFFGGGVGPTTKLQFSTVRKSANRIRGPEFENLMNEVELEVWKVFVPVVKDFLGSNKDRNLRRACHQLS